MGNGHYSRIPEIYVLWHPRCTLGEKLARRILGWIRPREGVGPNVFFRSMTAPGGPVGGLPLPLPGETRGQNTQNTLGQRISNEQILLPLIDANMIADASWRNWLPTLSVTGNSTRRVLVLPVALDSTAFNAPTPIRDQNFLRPSGLAAIEEAKHAKDSESEARAFEAVTRSLLKQLTESLCRYMLTERTWAEDSSDDAYVMPKLKVFLSHAKGDGTGPARRLRDYIYSQTQLAVFFDENDIAYGSAFADVLRLALNTRETAALIAVRTAKYADRPWCRRELSLFRRPKKEERATVDPIV